VQFSPEDIEFILGVLGTSVASTEALLQLLADPEARDVILDDERLLRAVLERNQCLRISTHFYFYILVRHSLHRSGLPDRAMTDYVAAVLAQFCHQERTRCHLTGGATDYFVDMLTALQTADETTSFYIRAHIGNQSLFLSGVFPDRLRYRTETKGAPSLDYYEGLGRANFRVASDHRLARQYDLDGIFSNLAERFQETRLALNDLRERLLSLGEPDYSGLLITPRSDDV
jgi:hypothetical protein